MIQAENGVPVNAKPSLGVNNNFVLDLRNVHYKISSLIKITVQVCREKL